MDAPSPDNLIGRPGGSAGITERRPGRFEITVIAACAAAIFFDGFDAQAIGYVGPSLIKGFHMAPSALGPVFSAGLVGIMLGALGIAPLADRFGRRPVILISILLFAAFTLATAWAGSVTDLLWLRLLTGLGLGGCMPNAIALTAEYSPANLRGFLVTLMFNGFTLGSLLGGVLAHQLIPLYGWRAVFVAGGGLPLVLLPVLYFVLPESLRFLALAGGDSAAVAAVLKRMGSTDTPASLAARLRSQEGDVPRSLGELFAEGRARASAVLWIVFFMSLLDVYLLVSWLPTALNQAGIAAQTAIILGSLLQVGALIGTLLCGAGLDRFGGNAVLVPAYLLAAVSIAAIGVFSSTSLTLTTIAVLLAGAGIIGGQTAANALAAGTYPTRIRSTGVGWALGIGRIGSIIGPLVASGLLLLHVSVRGIFLISAIPALVAAAALALFGPWRRRGAGDRPLARTEPV
jgi:AAHS family 4-hydroxybenzoate transporter-like MFS transporter